MRDRQGAILSKLPSLVNEKELTVAKAKHPGELVCNNLDDLLVNA